MKTRPLGHFEPGRHDVAEHGDLVVDRAIALYPQHTELVELGDRLGVEVFSYVGFQQLWWCYRELGDRDQMDRWYAETAPADARPRRRAALVPPLPLALLDGDLTTRGTG